MKNIKTGVMIARQQRMTLIERANYWNSHSASYLAYLAQIRTMDEKSIHEAEEAARLLLWGRAEQNRATMAWWRTIMPRQQGGLGLTDPRLKQRALKAY